MDRTELGRTGFRVSRLGLGTVELGIPYGLSEDPPPSDDVCIGLLREAFDEGIDYIDTAAAYGRSEELVGRAFSRQPERPTIATKVSLLDGNNQPLPEKAIAGHVGRSVERSLRLLQVERLDILKIHSADDRFLNPAIVDAMEDLKNTGRITCWGASTYERVAPADALSEPKLQVIQVAYSLLDRRLEAQILPRARNQGVGVVLRSVFLKGVLSDRRHQLQPGLEPLADAAEEAARIASSAGIPLSQLALRFAMYSGAGDVTLVGTAHQDELRQNLAAANAGPLAADIIKALEEIHVDDPSLLNPGNWPTEAT